MCQIPQLSFKNLEDYYAWALDYIAAMTGKQGLATKEKDFLIGLLFCQKMGVVLFSKECMKQLALRRWRNAHVFIYRNILIDKEWLVQDCDKECVFYFKDNIGPLLNINTEQLFQFLVKIEDNSLTISG